MVKTLHDGSSISGLHVEWKCKVSGFVQFTNFFDLFRAQIVFDITLESALDLVSKVLGYKNETALQNGLHQ